MFLTIFVLTGLFKYLPKFALAAIVLSSVIPLVAYNEARHLFKVSKRDFVLWMSAFFGTLLFGVLLGIACAVGISLVIVIYESARPQITILWRIPGTTIYRNVKQESSGAFIPNIFIARIGSSMYFANASFIKDMLLGYVADLDTVNKTEYIVLEMTPVVSIDSTAAHVIEDVVKDFRSRGIQFAFAMVGNRVEKTFRKAGLSKHIGKNWFFHTVHEAVQYCIRHQHIKKKQAPGQGLTDGGNENRVSVVPGNEIGFSNEMHHDCSAIFVSVAFNQGNLLNEISATLQRNQVNVTRAQIEPQAPVGTKHTYFVKSVKYSKDGSKLTDLEIHRLREDLDAVIQKFKALSASGDVRLDSKQVSSNSPPGSSCPDPSANDRFSKLEAALMEERTRSEDMYAEMKAQGKRLEALMKAQADTMGKSTDHSSV
jgi:anti-anti-sigma regulatory factor